MQHLPKLNTGGEMCKKVDADDIQSAFNFTAIFMKTTDQKHMTTGYF